MGKMLIVLGLIIAAMGVALVAGLPIGRLPGDIVMRHGSFTMYVPITTCIVVSLLLSGIMSLLRH